MQYRSRKLKSWVWLLAPLGVLVLLSIPALRAVGFVSFRLLLLGGLVLLLSSWYSRRSVTGLLRVRDDLSDEEAASRARLSQLNGQLEQVETAAKELRDAFRRSTERTHVEPARAALESRLLELRAAMARERAVLYSIQATRWQRRVEPLLRDQEWLDLDFEAADAELLEEWVQLRLDRVNGLRPRGTRLLAKLHTDSAAITLPAGQTLSALLQKELADLEHFRADLLALRTELVACNRPWEADQPDPEFLVQRLKVVLRRIRTRRDDRDRAQESTTAILRRNRASRDGGAPRPVDIGPPERPDRSASP